MMAMALTLLMAISGSGSAVLPSGVTSPLVWGPVLAGLWGGGTPQPDGQPPSASVVTPNEISPAANAAGPRASTSAGAASMSPGPAITEARPERPPVGAPPAEGPISLRELPPSSADDQLLNRLGIRQLPRSINPAHPRPEFNAANWCEFAIAPGRHLAKTRCVVWPWRANPCAGTL